MAAAGLIAQGTTFAFNGTVSYVKSIKHNRRTGEIPVTNLSSTEEEIIPAFTSREVTIEIFGRTSIANGDTETITITPPSASGSAITLNNMCCMGVDESYDTGGAITTSLTFKKSIA